MQCNVLRVGGEIIDVSWKSADQHALANLMKVLKVKIMSKRINSTTSLNSINRGAFAQEARLVGVELILEFMIHYSCYPNPGQACFGMSNNIHRFVLASRVGSPLRPDYLSLGKRTYFEVLCSLHFTSYLPFLPETLHFAVTAVGDLLSGKSCI